MVSPNSHNPFLFCTGNIRVFCRVRPFLPGEMDCGRESICSNGSRGSGKGSKVTSSAQLQIQYPDKDVDGKKIALQYSSEQVSTVVFEFVFMHASSIMYIYYYYVAHLCPLQCGHGSNFTQILISYGLQYSLAWNLGCKYIKCTCT